MEIRKVENVEPNYPEIKNMSKSKIKNAIPNKWAKLGISTFLISLIMQKQTVDTSMALALTPGIMPNPVPKEVILCNQISEYVLLVTVISFIVSVLNIMILIFNRFKKKEEDDNEKLIKSNKIVKIILIISSTIFVLSIIAQIILDKIIASF